MVGYGVIKIGAGRGSEFGFHSDGDSDGTGRDLFNPNAMKVSVVRRNFPENENLRPGRKWWGEPQHLTAVGFPPLCPTMPSKLKLPTEPAYYVQDSIIHGRGLYASRDIAKGERILEYLGEKVTKAESERRGNALMAESKQSGGGAVRTWR